MDPGCIFPLELLHPDGVVARPLVVGSGTPSRVASDPQEASARCADLLVVHPTIEQSRSPGWLDAALRALQVQLGGDGVGYVLAPPRVRWQARRRLSAMGLSNGPALIHLPDVASSRLLVPRDPVLLRHVFAHLVRTGRRVPAGGVAAIAARLAGCRLAESLLPGVGLVVRRPGARPLFDWLFRLDGDVGPRRGVVISRRALAETRSVLLHRFSGAGAHPSAVAKVARGASDATRGEADALATLGPGARAAGATVPAVLATGRVGDRFVLLETAVPGRLAAAILTSHPGRAEEIADRLTGWLESWARATAVPAVLGAAWIEREVLRLVPRLVPALPAGSRYPERLAQLARAAERLTTPLVAAHGDLTMWNVLVGGGGQLAVVDWEKAHRAGLPLADFFYAIVDIEMLAAGRPSRVDAFTACFARGGRRALTTARRAARLARAAGTPPAVVELCFHACWLRHAADEVNEGTGVPDKGFVPILRWLATHESALEWNVA